jgi:hypothetical protein
MSGSDSLSALASGLAVWPGLLLAVGGALKLLEAEEEDSVLLRVLPAQVSPRAVAAAELLVGALVLVGLLTPVPEALAALLLAGATGVSVWGVRHAPESSCGCFGRRSEKVSPRTIARAGLLAALALIAVLGGEAWWNVFSSVLAIVVVALAGVALAVLTPELQPRNFRVRAREAACKHKPVSVNRTVSRLRASDLWREAREYLAADAPAEQWRDGCFRYLVYPANYDGEAATAVFALYLGRDRAADGVAFVSDEEQRVLGQITGGKRA